MVKQATAGPEKVKHQEAFGPDKGEPSRRRPATDKGD